MSKSTSKTDFKMISSSSISTSKRIESPLAKYNSLGQLTCIICNQIIKSELIWNAHLNSKLHLENKQKLKSKLIAQQEKSMPPPPVPILFKNETLNDKNDAKVLKRPISSQLDDKTTNSKKHKIDNLIKKTDSINLNKINVNKSEKFVEKTVDTSTGESKLTVNATATASELPEGFFDDPEMDDKIRGVSREANLEAEYEEFKKIIQAEEHKSDIIVEQDDALRDVVRDLEQVDDLIGRWTKIECLHQKREALLAANKIKKTSAEEHIMDHDHDDKILNQNDDQSESDDDLDNVMGLTLRSKHRC